MNKYNTKQKEILTLFFKDNKDSQFSVNEIAERICNEYKIGKSTVYRLVKELTEAGIIRCFHDRSLNMSLYQYADKHIGCEHHLHLKCNSCQKIIHLECEHSEMLKSHISLMHNFNIDTTSSVLYGYCSSCVPTGVNK